MSKIDYFIVIPIEKVENEKETLLPKQYYSFVKRFFFWKFKGISYYEPYTNKGGYSFIVFGSSKIKEKKLNRNVCIFLLELYASMENGPAVTEDFPKKIKIIKGKEIQIYKVKNFK